MTTKAPRHRSCAVACPSLIVARNALLWVSPDGSGATLGVTPGRLGPAQAAQGPGAPLVPSATAAIRRRPTLRGRRAGRIARDNSAAPAPVVPPRGPVLSTAAALPSDASRRFQPFAPLTMQRVRVVLRHLQRHQMARARSPEPGLPRSKPAHARRAPFTRIRAGPGRPPGPASASRTGPGWLCLRISSSGY